MTGLAGCGGKQEVAETAPQGMTVEVEFHPVHRCSRLSPAILVTDVPRGTSYFDVRLVEMEPVERLLGGGTWSNDGSGKIAEGGLTKLYSGPCPPAGEERRYSYVISAMPFRRRAAVERTYGGDPRGGRIAARLFCVLQATAGGPAGSPAVFFSAFRV